jgi:hypothetical protein
MQNQRDMSPVQSEIVSLAPLNREPSSQEVAQAISSAALAGC